MATGLIFLAILSVLVLIHELGHFVAARILGIKVEEFAFGLPFTKPIFKIKKGETQYALYPLLFGGFVRLYGEDSPPSLAATEGRSRSFWDRGRKQRMAVVGAGVVMNFVLAMVGFVVLYAVMGVPRKIENKVTIIGVEQGSPAEMAGLRVDDRVVEVEGKKIDKGTEFSRLMKSWGGLGVNIVVERGQTTPLIEGIVEKDTERLTVTVVPRANPPEGQGPLGVGIGDFPYISSNKCSMLNAKCSIGAVLAGVKTTGEWVERVFDGLRSIGKSLSHGKAPDGVAGPIGIYQLTDVVSQGGFWPILELTAVLSVNLAVFNILPIPALDGGRMFFIWLEWVRRKRVTAELEQKINSWGMAVLLALMALITLQDVIRTGILGKIFGR